MKNAINMLITYAAGVCMGAMLAGVYNAWVQSGIAVIVMLSIVSALYASSPNAREHLNGR